MIVWLLETYITTGGTYSVWVKVYLDLCQGRIRQPTALVLR